MSPALAVTGLVGAPGYLLGFPTPVVEIFLTLVALFLAVAIYLGTQMEGTRGVRERATAPEVGEEVNE